MTGWTNGEIAGSVANGCNTVRQQNGDPEKRGLSEYGQWAAGVAAKVDLTGMSHQIKYRVKDEAAAGITSPIKEREQELKAAKLEDKQAGQEGLDKPEGKGDASKPQQPRMGGRGGR